MYHNDDRALGTGVWDGMLLSWRPSRGFGEMSPLPHLLISQIYKQPIKEEHSLNPKKLSYLWSSFIGLKEVVVHHSCNPFRDLSLVVLHDPSWTRPQSFYHYQFAINISLNNYKEYYHLRRIQSTYCNYCQYYTIISQEFHEANNMTYQSSESTYNIINTTILKNVIYFPFNQYINIISHKSAYVHFFYLCLK